jgi:hypothetical protein
VAKKRDGAGFHNPFLLMDERIVSDIDLDGEVSNMKYSPM